MSAYKWQGNGEDSRILRIDVFSFGGTEDFECKDFYVEFACIADAHDFIGILDHNNYHYIRVGKTGKSIYLKPKCCETCRKTFAFLRGYDFLPKDIKQAYTTLHLLHGQHWFDTSHFQLTRPY